MAGALTRYLARRLVAAVVLVALISCSAVVLVRLAPGDATDQLGPKGRDRATIEQERARLGLDQPIATQLRRWIAGAIHLDLGRSSSHSDAPVAPLAVGRAANTALLAGAALALATVLGLPIGLITGAYPRGVVARVVTPLSVALVACPPIVGVLVLLCLALRTGWLPIGSDSLIVPVLALALPLAASLERLQSRATADALAAPDLVAAAARGVPPSRLLWRHASRQSLGPVLGIYGVVIGGLFSGSLAVEVVTQWPGLGRLMYDALEGRDVNLAAGCALVGALVLAAGNLAADLLRAMVDPRVRDAR